MKKHTHRISLLAISAVGAGLALTSYPAQALDNIIHEYMSVRTEGMGGTRMTTGLYEENFFSNPARVTANPTSKLEVLGVTAEGAGIGNISTLVKGASGSGDIVSALGGTAGNNTHLRLETDLFNYFLASNEDRKWALAFGIFTSTQIDMDLRQSFQVGAQGITDAGANLTFGHKFLNNKLSVGTTGHGIFRVATNPNFTFLQLLQGKSLSPANNAGEGILIDFDLGGTYELPIFRDSPYKFSVGLAIDNVLGGSYGTANNLVSNFNCAGVTGCKPIGSPRSLGLGISANRESWGVFTNSSLALEFTDIGADGNSNLGGTSPDTNLYGSGGIFRTVHIGGETHWKVFAPRVGINQGYLAAGLGVDLRFLMLDFAYYGEEMSLNSGGLEDRRIAFKLTLQI